MDREDVYKKVVEAGKALRQLMAEEQQKKGEVDSLTEELASRNDTGDKLNDHFVGSMIYAAREAWDQRNW